MKLIWSSTHRARKDHDRDYCTECDLPIFAGDWYIREVYSVGKRLWIQKRHVSCPIDPDFDPDEKYEYDDVEYLLAA